MSLYYLGNARTPTQADRMRLLEESSACLFCPPQMDLEPVQGLAPATEHCVVRHNDYPCRGTRLHLMAIPRHHVTDLVDLPDDALAEFWQVVRDARNRYRLKFYRDRRTMRGLCLHRRHDRTHTLTSS
ncbi:hypothetical protein FRAHR75_330021 [Frankia sp. Hr75.2]|nr:hypothetical protein FRAHR75_330021 [Frankia sp. Hr75.2]